MKTIISEAGQSAYDINYYYKVNLMILLWMK